MQHRRRGRKSFGRIGEGQLCLCALEGPLIRPFGAPSPGEKGSLRLPAREPKREREGADMPDIRTILIANRGEIACRVMRTAKAMSYRTAAVYSDVDADALHVRSADVAASIGPAEARASYLNAAAIIAAAKR